MEWQIVALIWGVGLLALLFIGVPIPWGLGLLAVVLTFLVWENPLAGIQGFVNQAYNQGTSFIVLGVPFFILMAELILNSGMSSDAYDAFSKLLGRLPGGLAIATITIAAGFAAITGSSMANAAIIGRVSIPEMNKHGYSQGFSGSCVAAGGTLGILIPPSIPMIFYALFADESVGKMFTAGIIPGIMLSAMLIVYILIHATIKPAMAPRVRGFTWKETVRSSYKILPLIFLILFMLFGFYLGFAAPTEIAGLGAFVSFIISIAYKRLNMKMLRESILITVRTTLLLMWILIAALSLGQVLNYSRVLENLTNFVVMLPISPIGVVIVMQLFLLVIGCVLETTTIIMVISPILIAIAKALGLDLIWFGILFVINLELALITPPVGFNLFMLKSIAPDIKMTDIYKSIWPFVGILCVALGLVLAFPDLALWLSKTRGI